MSKYKKHSHCPLYMAGLLDSKLRRYFFNPAKTLKPYIRKNMTALDFGCGPGVYSTEMAELMEGTGKVIAVDMQPEMLEIIKRKITGKPIEQNIVLHQCTQEKVGVHENLDFVLMFYVVHEVPSKVNLFKEVLPLMKKEGLIMVVEPKTVSAYNFNDTVNLIKAFGFEEYARPEIIISRAIVLQKR